MEQTLTKEIIGIDVTDELIAINKKYNKLGEIYDGYEKLLDILRNQHIWGTPSKEERADPRMVDREKQITQLEKMQSKVGKEMSTIYEEVKNELYLHRMIKGAIALKVLK